jgi:hypothetical protein
VDKGAAAFAFQMKMFPAVFFVFYILITGTFVIKPEVFADLSRGPQFFKMPVDGSLPDGVFGVLEMAQDLGNRYMPAPKGLHIIKNALSLPGMIICRTFICHNRHPIIGCKHCQYENEYYFHIG